MKNRSVKRGSESLRDPQSLGDVIRGLREITGMSQAELGKILKLKQPGISRYENGERTVLSKRIRKKLSETFDIDYDMLSALTGEMTGNVKKEITKSALDYFRQELNR